jgi:hypothetical protein
MPMLRRGRSDFGNAIANLRVGLAPGSINISVLSSTVAAPADMVGRGEAPCDQIRLQVNLTAPGAIAVPRNEDFFASLPMRKTFRHLIPVGAAGSPGDIAHVALFLAEGGKPMSLALKSSSTATFSLRHSRRIRTFPLIRNQKSGTCSMPDSY